MCTCRSMLWWRSGKQHCEVGSLPLYVAWAWVLGFEWQMLSPWMLSQCPPHPIFSWTLFITFNGKPSTIWYIIFLASELKNESHRKEKSGFFTQTQHVLCFDADVGRRGVGSEGNSCYPRRLGIDFWCCRPSSLPSTKALADVGDVSSWSLTVTGCTGTFSLSGFCSVQVRYSYFVFVYVALAGLNLIIDLSPPTSASTTIPVRFVCCWQPPLLVLPALEPPCLCSPYVLGQLYNVSSFHLSSSLPKDW